MNTEHPNWPPLFVELEPLELLDELEEGELSPDPDTEVQEYAEEAKCQQPDKQ